MKEQIFLIHKVTLNYFFSVEHQNLQVKGLGRCSLSAPLIVVYTALFFIKRFIISSGACRITQYNRLSGSFCGECYY